MAPGNPETRCPLDQDIWEEVSPAATMQEIQSQKKSQSPVAHPLIPTPSAQRPRCARPRASSMGHLTKPKPWLLKGSLAGGLGESARSTGPRSGWVQGRMSSVCGEGCRDGCGAEGRGAREAGTLV